MNVAILRLPTVKARTGYSRSTIYLRISQRLWTRPVSLGPRAVGWPDNEVEALNGARIAGKSEADIRMLVHELEEARRAPTGRRCEGGAVGQDNCTASGSAQPGSADQRRGANGGSHA
jgi:prophage regulatory protein